jgi:hypothetical protein
MTPKEPQMHEEQFPPMPEAVCVHGGGVNLSHRYTADQMREYGRQCASLAKPQPVGGALTDAAILHRWDTHVGEPDAKRPLTDADKIDFARAVLALATPIAAQPAAAPNPAGMGVLIALTKEKNKLHTALELACNYLTDEQAAQVAAAMPDEAAPAQAAAVPEAVERDAAVKTAVLNMGNAGALLSNCAFNLAQRKGEAIDQRTAETLDECRKGWDAAWSNLRAALSQGDVSGEGEGS